MVLWWPARPSRTNTKIKDVLFIIRTGMQCRQSRDTWSNMQVWPSSTKWSRAKCFKSFAKRTHWDVLSKTLILFYVDGCGCVPPCYLFGLRWPSPGVYRLSGSAIGDLQGKLDTSPRTAAATAPVPVVGHCQHTPLQEALKHSDMSGSVSCGVNFPFLSVLVWARFCLQPPRVECLFPQSCEGPVIRSC